jgi:hypothetical protein
VEECNETALLMMPCDNALAKYPSFFRFFFVRNPFMRAISAFLMASRPEFMQDGKLLTFEEWARDLELLNTHLYALHWMPATDFLYTESRCRVPDFVGKQETLEADLRAALKRIGNKEILEHLDVHGMPHVSKAFQNGSDTAKFLTSQYCTYVASCRDKGSTRLMSITLIFENFCQGLQAARDLLESARPHENRGHPEHRHQGHPPERHREDFCQIWL